MITHSYSDITDWFIGILQKLLQNQETVTIALPGGHSLDGWYASMIADSDAWRGIEKARLRWCPVDERCVSVDSLDRNDSYVWETFLKPLGFFGEQFFCLGMPEVNALEYSEAIRTPDIAIFGLGPDGHIASLFPRHPILHCEAEWYITLYDSPKPPSTRITLTVPSIQKIPHTALFAVGTEKQTAFENFLDSHKTFFDCPAKILQPDIIYRV